MTAESFRRDGRYQVLPALSRIEFEALKQDIAERGVINPIELDEEGQTLDGHHRIRACEELGLTGYPVFVRTGLATDIAKRAYARQANSLRRQLTRAQKRELIAGQLRDTPTWADARIAKLLGVSDKTVRATRRALEAGSEIPPCTMLEGEDGKRYPSTLPVRSVFIPDGGALDWDDLCRVAKEAAALPPAQARRRWTQEGFFVIPGSPPDPFAGDPEPVVLEWHLFVLFLVERSGFSVEGAVLHAQWVRGRFATVSEWFGEAGAAWRGSAWQAIPAATIADWQVFAARHAERTPADVARELQALNPALTGGAAWPGISGQASK